MRETLQFKPGQIYLDLMNLERRQSRRCESVMRRKWAKNKELLLSFYLTFRLSVPFSSGRRDKMCAACPFLNDSVLCLSLYLTFSPSHFLTFALPLASSLSHLRFFLKIPIRPLVIARWRIVHIFTVHADLDVEHTTLVAGTEVHLALAYHMLVNCIHPQV